MAIPLFILALVCIIIAFLVLLRGYKRPTNVVFSIFTLSVGLWNFGIGAFLLVNSTALALGFARLYYVAPVLIASTMLLFALSFPAPSRLFKRYARWAGLSSLLMVMLVLLVKNFVITGIVYQEWGKEVTLNIPTYIIYSSYIVGNFSIAIILFLLKAKRLRGVYQSQANLVLYGLLIAAPLGLIFNLLLPGIGNYRLIHLGPLASNFFLVAIGYSIIRHRMFDIRLIMARSMAYILSISVIAALYGFIMFLLVSQFFGFDISLFPQVFISLTTAIAAVSFPLVKRFFDDTTRKIFRPDDYDPQKLLNKINKSLLGSIDIKILASEASKVLEEEMGLQRSAILLKRGSERRVYVSASFSQKISGGALLNSAAISLIDSYNGRGVLLISEVDDIDQNNLPRIDGVEVSAISGLSAVYAGNDDYSGVLILGAKKSGSLHGRGDEEFIQILADEIGIALQNALQYEEIEGFNLTLQQKVDDATRKLRKSNEKLKALDESKDEFISMASHQLRTPLTSMKGYVSMVLEGDVGEINDGQRKMLSQAFVSSQRMASLISDLLNVSRLRTGKFVIERSRVDLADVVQSEVDQLRDTAKARGLELQYDKPDDFPYLMLDETKTRQVVMNFIDNSIYYTPTGGMITVSLKNKEKTIELTVTDNGIGVPKAEQPHLFTKFYRAGNARKARPDGTGLGLFMAKKVIVAQGGAVIFKTVEGHGSVFGFTFSKDNLRAE